MFKGESNSEIYPRIGYGAAYDHGVPKTQLRTTVRIERSGVWYRVDLFKNYSIETFHDIMVFFEGFLVDINDIIHVYTPGDSERDSDQRSEKERLIQARYGRPLSKEPESFIQDLCQREINILGLEMSVKSGRLMNMDLIRDLYGEDGLQERIEYIKSEASRPSDQYAMAMEEHRLRHEQLLRDLYGDVKRDLFGFVKRDRSFEDALHRKLEQGEITFSGLVSMLFPLGVDYNKVIQAASDIDRSPYEPFKIQASSHNNYIAQTVLGDKYTEIWGEKLTYYKYLFYHGSGVLKGSNDDDTFDSSELNEITIEDL